MPSHAQNDTIVGVKLSRLRDWAAKRAVADTLLREKAWNVARARAVIEDLRAATVGCDTTIKALVKYNTKLRGDVEQLQKDNDFWEAKVKKQRPWAIGAKVALVGVLIGGGFLIAKPVP